MKYKWFIFTIVLLLSISIVVAKKPSFTPGLYNITFTADDINNSKTTTIDKTSVTMTIGDQNIITANDYGYSIHKYLVTFDDTKNNKVRDIVTAENKVKKKKGDTKLYNLTFYPVTNVQTIITEVTTLDAVPIEGFKTIFYNYTLNGTNTTLTGNYTTAYLLRYDYIPVKHNVTSYKYTYDTAGTTKNGKTKKGAVQQYILELQTPNYNQDQFNITFTMDGTLNILIDPTISGCGLINIDNSTYTITTNIGTGAALCLNITANNVVIDGQNNITIDGGIAISGTNVTIQNLTLIEGYNESLGGTQGQYNRIGIKGYIDTKIYNVNITGMTTPTGATGTNGGSSLVAKPGNYSGNVIGIYDDYNIIINNCNINNLATGNGGTGGNNGNNGVNTCYTAGAGGPSGNLYGIYASTTSIISNVNMNNLSTGRAGTAGTPNQGYSNPCNGATGGSAGNLTGIYANTSTVTNVQINNVYAGGGGNANIAGNGPNYMGAGAPGGDSGRIIGANIQGTTTINTLTLQNLSIGIGGNGSTGNTGSYTGTDGGAAGNSKTLTTDGGFIYGIISTSNTNINGLIITNVISAAGGVPSNGGSSGNQQNNGGTGGAGGDSGSVYAIYGSGITATGLNIQNIQTNTPTHGGSGGYGSYFNNVGLGYQGGGRGGDSGDIRIINTASYCTLSNTNIYNLTIPNGADNSGITSGVLSGYARGGNSGSIYIINTNDTTTANNVTLNLATTGNGGNSPNMAGAYPSTSGIQSAVGGKGGYVYGINAYTATINGLNMYNIITGNGGTPGTMTPPACYQCGSSNSGIYSVSGTPGSDGGLIYVAYLLNTSTILNVHTQTLYAGNGSRAQDGMYGFAAGNAFCGGNGGNGGNGGATGAIGLYITGTGNNISGVIFDDQRNGTPGGAGNGGGAGSSGGYCYGPPYYGPVVAGVAGSIGTNWQSYALYNSPNTTTYFYNFICRNYVDLSSCYYPAINYTLSFNNNATTKQVSGSNSTFILNATVSNVSYNTSIYLNNLSQEMLVGSYYLSVSIGSNSTVTVNYPQDTSVTSQTGYNNWGTGSFYVDSSSNSLGFAIYTNNTMAHSVTVSRYNASVTATICKLRTMPNGTNIATGTFSGDNCTMNYTMLPNTQYYVVADANGSSYTRYQPLTYNPNIWGGSWGTIGGYQLIYNQTLTIPTKAFWTYFYGWYPGGSSTACIFNRYDYTDGTYGDGGAGCVPGYSPTLMGDSNPYPDKIVYAVETWATNAPRSFTMSGVTTYIAPTNTTTSGNGIIINGGIDNNNSSNSTGNLASITYSPFNNQQIIITNANPQIMSGVVTLPSIDNTTIGWRYYAFDKAYTKTFESPIFLLTTIGNAKPIVSSVTLGPTFPYTTTTLQAYCTASDADTPIITYHYNWYKNNVLFSSGDYGANVTQNTTVNLANLQLNSSITIVGDNWTIGCIPDDNIEYGVEVISTPLTIIDFTIFFNNGTTPNNAFLGINTINISISSLNNGNLLGNTVYVYDYLGNIEYSNFTNESDFNITYALGQGTHYFNATTVQTNLSQKWTETRQVFIDTAIPSIYYGAGTDPSGSYFNRTYISVSPTVITIYLNHTESNLYYSNGSLAQTIYGENQILNFTNLTDGIYYFNSTAYANSGLYNSTETRNVTILARPPSISFNTPPTLPGPVNCTTIQTTLYDAATADNIATNFENTIGGTYIYVYDMGGVGYRNPNYVMDGLTGLSNMWRKPYIGGTLLGVDTNVTWHNYNNGLYNYICVGEAPYVGINYQYAPSTGYCLDLAYNILWNAAYIYSGHSFYNPSDALYWGGLNNLTQDTLHNIKLYMLNGNVVLVEDGVTKFNGADPFTPYQYTPTVNTTYFFSNRVYSAGYDGYMNVSTIKDISSTDCVTRIANRIIPYSINVSGPLITLSTVLLYDANMTIINGSGSFGMNGSFNNLSDGTYYLQGVATNLVGNTNYTDMREYIIYQLFPGNITYPTYNQTIGNTQIINYTVATSSGNVDIDHYTIKWLNLDYTPNITIINNNGLSLSYNWTQVFDYSFSPGQYYLQVIATDIYNQTVNETQLVNIKYNRITVLSITDGYTGQLLSNYSVIVTDGDSIRTFNVPGITFDIDMTSGQTYTLAFNKTDYIPVTTTYTSP